MLWLTSNWLLDCACFAMMFEAGATPPIPWKGLLLAHRRRGQLAATLPITPGGLGRRPRGASPSPWWPSVARRRAITVDAVLMYRLISFLADPWVGGAPGACVGDPDPSLSVSRDSRTRCPAGGAARRPADQYGVTVRATLGVPS